MNDDPFGETRTSAACALIDRWLERPRAEDALTDDRLSEIQEASRDLWAAARAARIVLDALSRP